MVLVVLDDIWKRLDLKEVGIPFGNQHKECKILLPSRDQNVLSNGMDADKTFAIDNLDDKEAWDLFRKMARDSVESAELQSTAIEVAKECARLPLAIATIASLVRRDANIVDLMKYAIGLGLIKGVDSLEKARNRADVLKNWPEEEIVKKCKKIHLGFPGITELPDELNCPQLVYFRVEVEGHASHRTNASLAELKNLSRLTALEVHILDVEATSGGLFFEALQKLERYKIFLENDNRELFDEYECTREHSRTLLLDSSITIDHLDHGIKMFLKKIETLYLYIINDNDAIDKIEFSQLRSLILRSLLDHTNFCSEDKSGSTSMPQHELSLFSEKKAWSWDDLPRRVALTMHQGSMVTSMYFHPSLHTLLLVGSVNGEITLWELGMLDKLVTKPFKIWDMTACSMTFQALMLNDTPISANRVTWNPDGSLVRVAFSKHLIYLYASHGSNDLIQRLEAS
ncbi:hypothetical protein POUND7_000113 [Theobroma cacao]